MITIFAEQQKLPTFNAGYKFLKHHLHYATAYKAHVREILPHNVSNKML